MLNSVDRWVEQAQYDLETARAMLQSGRYLYVLFCCQQAVEKALKALIVKQTAELPPRTHSLPRLADAAGITIEAAELDFIAELSVHYIQTRYPEEMDALAKAVTVGKAESTLATTEAIVGWLFSKLM